jgi:hypothetical protein
VSSQAGAASLARSVVVSAGARPRLGNRAIIRIAEAAWVQRRPRLAPQAPGSQAAAPVLAEPRLGGGRRIGHVRLMDIPEDVAPPAAWVVRLQRLLHRHGDPDGVLRLDQMIEALRAVRD